MTQPEIPPRLVELIERRDVLWGQRERLRKSCEERCERVNRKIMAIDEEIYEIERRRAGFE